MTCKCNTISFNAPSNTVHTGMNPQTRVLNDPRDTGMFIFHMYNQNDINIPIQREKRKAQLLKIKELQLHQQTIPDDLKAVLENEEHKKQKSAAYRSVLSFNYYFIWLLTTNKEKMQSHQGRSRFYTSCILGRLGSFPLSIK